jgi:hypothetical protein
VNFTRKICGVDSRVMNNLRERTKRFFIRMALSEDEGSRARGNRSGWGEETS